MAFEMKEYDGYKPETKNTIKDKDKTKDKKIKKQDKPKASGGK